MSRAKTFLQMLKNKEDIKRSLFLNFQKLRVSHAVPDVMYVKMQYYCFLGKRINLQHPETFNEKLQWLKLYDRKDIYTSMVDKYEAKKYFLDHTKDLTCSVIETYGVWERFDDIDFDSLPNQFVLKCTHDSGSVIICRNKVDFNKEVARVKINNSLKNNGYWFAREWPYKNVKPRIIAEKYMEDTKQKELVDYKFYCFNGEPQFLYVSQGLENPATAKISFLTCDWKFAPFGRNDHAAFAELPDRPNGLPNMIEIAKRLSHGVPFLRVDLYEINNTVYFSELTFTPNGGYMPFSPEEWDARIGKYITII